MRDVSQGANNLSSNYEYLVNNIRAVKPEKAEKLENIIIQNAQRGVFQGKVSESQMIGLLDQISEVEAEKAITVEVSKHKFDDEDDLDLDALDL